VTKFANMALKKPLWKDTLVFFIFHFSRAINQIKWLNSPTWPSKNRFGFFIFHFSFFISQGPSIKSSD